MSRYSAVEETGSSFVQANGIQIHYNDIGEGYPVVCVHGGGPGASGWSNFKQNVPALTEKYRLLLFDMPQFGRSEKVVIEKERLTYVAKTLRDFMDALDIEKAHFIANSMGAQSSIKFAIDYPDRIDRLVALGNTAMPHSIFMPRPSEGIKIINEFYGGDGPTLEKMRRLVQTLVYDSSFLTEELLQERFEAATDPEAVALWTNNPPAPQDISGDLGKVACPTLLIWGSDDRFSPIDSGLSQLKRFKQADMHIFSKCGHWAQVERAEEFDRLVLDFFARG